jgi:enterochelin esterase family protein
VRRLEQDTVTFQLADPDRRLAGVRLVPELVAARDRLDFGFDELVRAWQLQLPRPPVWRMEYRLELRQGDGHTELVCDPGNPHRVGGAFGDRSVLECTDYREPMWLHLPPADGSWRELTIPAPAIKANVPARIWSPPAELSGPAEPAQRLLVAHDGPEYDQRAALGRYSAAMVSLGAVAPHHLVLLAPVERSEWYSASPAYSWALVADILPRVFAELGTTGPVVGMGASLGGLAMLHAQRRYPRAFGGLFLQSASFLRPRYDRHESGFRRYLRIVRYVGKVIRAADGPAVPTVLTCGQAEENLHNNREMAQALRRHGYPVQLFEVPDAHNYTGWRDAFDPYLTDLLRQVWS